MQAPIQRPLLDIRSIWSSSLADAWPLFFQQQYLYLALAFLSALSGAYASSFPGMQTASTDNYGIELWVLIGQCFVIPSALRTENPAFKMTAEKLIVGFFIALGAALVALLGFLALIVPGIWLGTRLSLSYMLYLRGVQQPYQASWKLTEWYFWQLFFAFFISIPVIFIVAFIVTFPVTLLSIWFPIFHSLMAALAFGTRIWASAFVTLMTLRLTLRLLEIRPDTEHARLSS